MTALFHLTQELGKIPLFLPFLPDHIVRSGHFDFSTYSPLTVSIHPALLLVQPIQDGSNFLI